jgi:hypothetical protein
MNTNHHRINIWVFLSTFAFSSCVSVSLQKTDTVAAKDVNFESPALPFESISLKSADKTWISKASGNTISFLSDCQKNSDPTLEQMQNETTSVVDNVTVIESNSIPFNSRTGLTSTVEGMVDGVPVKMKVLVFKKNTCNYTLTFAGVKKHFDQELKYFEQFQASFKAP